MNNKTHTDPLHTLFQRNPEEAGRIALEILQALSAQAAFWRATINPVPGTDLAAGLNGQQQGRPVELSIILPVYNEAGNIPNLYDRICKTLDAEVFSGGVEIIFVNDGSLDDSARLIAALHEKDPRVKLLTFSRNFGHQAAVSAGLDYSLGEAVVLMDADLQDPPELLADMLRRWHSGVDVVYAVRRKRKESLVKRAAYFSFYRLLRLVSDIKIPLDSGDFCLMDRKVVNQLKALPEKNRFLRGLRSWVGFTQEALEYERAARHAGDAKYTFKKLIRLALDGILSFSSFPLRLATYSGLFTCLAGVGYLGYALGMYFFIGSAPRGWTSLIALMLLIGGTQLILLGAIGEYIARIYDETKQRPSYIVRDFLE
jgi:dolichol-phosphate mannosyltransferase